MWEFAIFSASPHPSFHPCMSLNYAPTYLKIGMNLHKWMVVTDKLPIQNILNYIRYGPKHIKFPNFLSSVHNLKLKLTKTMWDGFISHLLSTLRKSGVFEKTCIMNMPFSAILGTLCDSLLCIIDIYITILQFVHTIVCLIFFFLQQTRKYPVRRL